MHGHERHSTADSCIPLRQRPRFGWWREAGSSKSFREPKAAGEWLRQENVGYRRDHLRALAHRLEVADKEVRIGVRTNSDASNSKPVEERAALTSERARFTLERSDSASKL
ncbi:hypothetical protein MPLB_1640069 [Mesorhizobium sp. ORS 3324]|nr:hypothetical protein MPLB_1640069 [Mesorhizobium sp. ORS 3324]